MSSRERHEPRRSIADGLLIGEGPPNTTGPAAAPGRRRAVLVWGAAVMIVGAMGLSAWRLAGRPRDPGVDSRRRVAIDAITGEVFERFAIRDGDTQPWKHPRTGERTMYAAEACLWERDGGAKLEPTWVLLNRHSGKTGPTICPDCGRDVVPHNPGPPPAMMSEVARARKR